jgi:hypothetical protein
MISVTAPYAALFGVSIFVYFIVYPIVVYYRDAKGMHVLDIYS